MKLYCCKYYWSNTKLSNDYRLKRIYRSVNSNSLFKVDMTQFVVVNKHALRTMLRTVLIVWKLNQLHQPKGRLESKSLFTKSCVLRNGQKVERDRFFFFDWNLKSKSIRQHEQLFAHHLVCSSKRCHWFTEFIEKRFWLNIDSIF